MARPTRIDEVLSRMEAEAARLPPPVGGGDGVAAFHHLYFETTRAVAQALADGGFRSPAFLEALDVDFACLYFDALAAAEGALASVPHAWRPLFACRRDARIAPLQFALAGMNAHINRDLPVALVTAAARFGVPLAAGTAEHHDFLTINRILAATQERVKARLVSGALERLDVAFGTVDDRIALFSVERARDAAWINGRLLLLLGAQPELRSGFLTSLDKMVGFAGRGLLLPLG